MSQFLRMNNEMNKPDFILKIFYERKSKIEKAPRGIRGEKSSKDTASCRNLVSTTGALASPKMGTEPGVRKGKRSLLTCHTRCKCSMETTRNSVKIMKCLLTFVKYMISIKCTIKVLTFFVASALFKHCSVKCRMSFRGDVCDESLVEA